MQISEAAGGAPEAGAEPCRFPKLEECAHFHYERVQLPPLEVTLQTNMDQSLHSQHTNDTEEEYYMVQVTSGDECWLLQRNWENFKMLDAQLHQCIYDRKISQLLDLSSQISNSEDVEAMLIAYLERFCSIIDNSLNCGPVLNWLQMDNKGHRLLVPSEESRSINTPAVAAAYSVRRYVSQARDELNLEVGDMISVIDMASPGESIWWRGKRGFQVGFFPQHCVHIIGDKVPRNMPLPPPVVGSLALSPIKPVLRKHGKLIAFFRSFILNRPSRRRLKQSGILKERVFGCDLGEHLLNSGHDIPMVLKCCAEFIEEKGIVDGIYRLSGITSNIQKLRNAFDEDRIPNLYTEEILQDIHSVASLLKMYFRELPNPLCTYQLYQSFVNAVQGCNTATRNSENDHDRLLKMREAVQKLPPPHYRTLEYLMRHLARVAKHGSSTGMTTRNVAIVWAPNLLRSEELEGGGVAALQGVGVQAVVTEFLICYADLIFCDHLPIFNNHQVNSDLLLSPKRLRPKSLAISTPTKLITLEEARSKHQISKGEDTGYIEVGGGPKNLPKKYHTIIELPSGRKRGHAKRSPLGWRSFFSKSRNASQNVLSKSRKASTPGIIIPDKFVTESDITDMKHNLRSVKSAESLTSGLLETTNNEVDVLGPLHTLNKPTGHNRSVSHDSYFDTLQNSQNNSEGSLLDLSEIQLNFDLEESEMRIFSEDESLVSSPHVHKDVIHRKYLTRARPEDFSSAVNSNNPSPKKQARVVVSPDSLSRKRTRLEDQLSDIQFIDCNTPDNSCTISTKAIVHSLPQTKLTNWQASESYQPKNKSPKNSHVENKRQSLNLEQSTKPSIPKSLTEVDISGKLPGLTQSSTFATPTPQSPLYRPLADSSSTTPGDVSPPTEICYEKMNKLTGAEDNRSDRLLYENIVSPATRKSKSPTYENVLTTISITYKSPTKRFSNSQTSFTNSDLIYEDVINPEKAGVPTEPAVLPMQEANQPTINEDVKLVLPTTEQRPKSLSTLEDLKSKECYNSNMKTNRSLSTVCNLKSDSKTISSNNETLCRSLETTLNSSISSDFNVNNSNTSSISAAHYQFIENTELSPTDLSLSEVIQSSSENLSNQHSYPVTPVQNSLSPNVSPAQLFESQDTFSQDVATPESVNETSKTRNTSESSLLDDEHYLESERLPIKHPELLELSRSENLELSESPTRPVSVNLIDFSPNEMENRIDKRKSYETETLDDNSIYQQVKYFRRSVHEINALLDLAIPMPGSKTKETTNPLDEFRVSEQENSTSTIYDSVDFDSLERDAHVYENIDKSGLLIQGSLESKALQSGNPETDEICEKISVKNLTNKFEIKETKPPKAKRNYYENYCIKEKSPKKESKKLNDEAEYLGSSFTERICNLVEEKSKEENKLHQKVYGKDSVPPCVRARNLKLSIKTRSLDENEFTKECREQASERRKSLDENLGYSVNNPKVLNQPKKLPDSEKLDIHLTHSTESKINLLNDQKLNRERIEKYKEERRKILHEKYRSESFKEDKDILLLRLKIKPRDDDLRKSIKLETDRRKNSSSETEERRKNSLSENEEPGKNEETGKERQTNSFNKNPESNTRTDEFPGGLEMDKKYNIDKPSTCEKKCDIKMDVKCISEIVKTKTDVPMSESLKSRAAKFESQINQSNLDMHKVRMNECRNMLTDIKCNTKKVQDLKSNVSKNSFNDTDADMLSDNIRDTLCGDDFIRNRKRNDDITKSERRRHTYDIRERESESDRFRRVSLETKTPRKEKTSPSLCIKDMKAIFESKSQQ